MSRQKKFNENGVQIYDYYIYRVTLVTDGRTYIGKRYISLWYTPAAGMDKYTPGEYYGSGDHIKNAIKLYGVQNFTREIIDEYHDITDAEIKAIEKSYIQAEWAAGHGEFNHSVNPYSGNMFDGMPEDIKSEIFKKSMDTNRKNHGGILAWNTDKALQTNRDNHEGLLAWNTDLVREKQLITMTNRYGSPTAPLHTPEAIEKSIQTRLDKYGSLSDVMHTPDAMQKQIRTRIDKYGDAAWNLHTPEVRMKAVNSMSTEWVFYNPALNTYKIHVLNWTSRNKYGFTEKLCKYSDWDQYKSDHDLDLDVELA